MPNNPPIGCSLPRRPNRLRSSLALALCLGASACANSNQAQQAQTQAFNTAQGADVLNVADAAIAGDNPDMALKISQAVLASDPADLQALYHEGAAYYALGRCEDAIAAYQVALQHDPHSAEAQTGIGRCLLKRNAIEAEQAFAAAVTDDPQNAAAQSDLGIARALRGDLNGAVAPLQQSLLLSPGNTATEVDLGLVLALSGNSGDALQYLGPLAVSQAATPKIRADYALALVSAGRTQEASQVLAVDLPPDKVQEALAGYQGLVQPGTMAPEPAAPVPAPVATAAPASSAPVAQASAPVSIAPAMSAPPPAPVAVPVPTLPPAHAQMTEAAPAPAPVAMPVAAMAPQLPTPLPTATTVQVTPAPLAIMPVERPRLVSFHHRHGHRLSGSHAQHFAPTPAPAAPPVAAEDLAPGNDILR